MAERDPAARELAAAVAAMASFQQVTQQTDAKAGTLVTVHVGLAAVVSAQIGSAGAPAPTDLLAALFWLASLAYVLTFTVSGYLLVQVIRPRTGRHSEPNRFSLDAADHVGADNGQLAAQAWATARHREDRRPEERLRQPRRRLGGRDGCRCGPVADARGDDPLSGVPVGGDRELGEVPNQDPAVAGLDDAPLAQGTQYPVHTWLGGADQLRQLGLGQRNPDRDPGRTGPPVCPGQLQQDPGHPCPHRAAAEVLPSPRVWTNTDNAPGYGPGATQSASLVNNKRLRVSPSPQMVDQLVVQCLDISGQSA